ncbi:chemotaxis protein CheB [Dyella monticola]|uniref:protein-glutamate methylesterase n=1 Tax=Dyella monticola TaxID=1927958 RepID=A0A370X8L7_9GAMM|nr:chemotaxis protein CheB [Dyella monticola]RDS84652.1 chemotaxis protein CheB [Dyella monticola]
MKAASEVTAVALLFDDVELGGHLRSALSEHGARIAHEGPVNSFDADKLRQAGVDVLVVNLDESVDDAALDRIYELAGSGDIPVVFNDAQASGGLGGWDRARWARHLAAKALSTEDIDPPRPDNARVVDAPLVPIEPEEAAQQPEPIAAPSADEPRETEEAHVTAETSETLAAELEALLASDEPSDVQENEFGSGLKYNAHDELPSLHDGNFGWNDHDSEPAPHEEAPVEAAPPSPSHAELLVEATLPSPSRAEPPPFNINLDHLSLASFEEEVTPPVLEKATLAQQTPTPVAPEWGFVEEDSLAVSQSPGSKEPFGVEKMSAADYLAPDVEHLEGAESFIEPGMSLELESIEQAIAPREEYQPHETHLTELSSVLTRILVLGAASDGGDSLIAFLAALPDDFKLPILLAQHHGPLSPDQLAASLTARCALPIKVAAPGLRARNGEVVVAPRGQQVRITRDGRVELQVAADDASGQSPSIDSSFTMAASVFGRDALAIVFAGQATDAVAGAQAIHDRGGQVWVEASSSDHYTDMVNGVLAEHLASFSGSPLELAEHLADTLFHSA